MDLREQIAATLRTRMTRTSTDDPPWTEDTLADAVMAVVQPEIEQLRAELAEANRLVGTYMAAAQVAEHERKRAEQAEATIARVTALVEADEQCGPSIDRGVSCPNILDLDAALDQPGDQEGTTP
jgi:predicted Zn-dependent protease